MSHATLPSFGKLFIPCALLLTVGSAQGAVLFYEGFSGYNEGSSLSVDNASRWTTLTTNGISPNLEQWETANTGTITGSLSYGSLQVSGLAGSSTLLNNGTGTTSRAWVGQTFDGSVHQQVWVSWLGVTGTGGTTNNWTENSLFLLNGGDDRFTNTSVTFGPRNANDFSIDYFVRNASGYQNLNNSGIRPELLDGDSNTIPFSRNVNQAQFFVAHFDYLNSQVTLYLDPDPSSADPAATAQAKVTVNSTAALMTFDRIILYRYNTYQNSPSYIDEIRIGESWDDVSPVPEPAVFAVVMGLTAMVVLWHRRQPAGIRS